MGLDLGGCCSTPIEDRELYIEVPATEDTKRGEKEDSLKPQRCSRIFESFNHDLIPNDSD